MTDVIVVGGGPVGLFLGLRLLDLGLRPIVLERRAEARTESRSIGIHPPSLELLDRLEVGRPLLERGVRVRRGLAFAGRTPLGELSFEGCPGPHAYVLSVPQRITEAVLREALEARAPGALVRGAEVTELQPGARSVQVRYRDAHGPRRRRAPWAVACDGRRSACRRALRIGFAGGRYPGSYLMCDGPDVTPFGDRAAVFLCDDGLVESFPLPGGTRRWVVRRRARQAPGSLAELANEVQARTGWRLPYERAHGFSEFVAERYLAGALYRDRVALAGDAGHVISPIGGQGLNVGWLGAWSLGAALCEARDRGDDAPLRADARRRRRLVRAAARRAELNMWLGRPDGGAARRPLVRVLLRRPVAGALARLFTMRALEAGV